MIQRNLFWSKSTSEIPPPLPTSSTTTLRPFPPLPRVHNLNPIQAGRLPGWGRHCFETCHSNEEGGGVLPQICSCQSIYRSLTVCICTFPGYGRTPEAPAAHKETAHYKAWAETVVDMMAKPRSNTKYMTRFPGRSFLHNRQYQYRIHLPAIQTYSAATASTDTPALTVHICCWQARQPVGTALFLRLMCPEKPCWQSMFSSM